MFTEADTHTILHAKRTNGPTVIHSTDTDVSMLLLGHSCLLTDVHMKLCKGSKTRIIQIDEVKSNLFPKLHPQISTDHLLGYMLSPEAMGFLLLLVTDRPKH